MHEQQQPNRRLDKCQDKQDGQEILGLGVLVSDRYLDADDGEQSHPDANISRHAGSLIGCNCSVPPVQSAQRAFIKYISGNTNIQTISMKCQYRLVVST